MWFIFETMLRNEHKNEIIDVQYEDMSEPNKENNHDMVEEIYIF